MTGRLSKNFHGVGIGPLSKILAVKSCSQLGFFSTGPAAQTSPELIFHTIKFNMSQDSSVSTDLWSKRHLNTDTPSKEPLGRCWDSWTPFLQLSLTKVAYTQWSETFLEGAFIFFGNCDLKGVFQTVKGWILNTIQSWNVQVGCHQIYLCYC